MAKFELIIPEVIIRSETFLADYWRSQSTKEIDWFVGVVRDLNFGPDHYLDYKGLVADLVRRERLTHDQSKDRRCPCCGHVELGGPLQA